LIRWARDPLGPRIVTVVAVPIWALVSSPGRRSDLGPRIPTGSPFWSPFRAARGLPLAHRRGPHDTFSGAWAAVDVGAAAHAPEEVHARWGAPGRGARFEPRV